MGILGMSVFACDRRTKEIGIRKVNGASTAEILLMLNRDFLKWVFIAFLCAAPIAWYLLHRWLGNFAYRTELSWWVFMSAAGIVLSLAFIAINWQVIRVALKNPVDALRYE
jgi:putative ABC transport system permease protein